MAKKFEWTKDLMRRAREEFPCIECAFEERVSYFHRPDCTHGIFMDFDLKMDRIDIWGFWLQEILEAEKNVVRPSQRCSTCSQEATGTTWVSYHDTSKGRVLFHHQMSCETCSLIPPPEIKGGVQSGDREWGYINIVSEDNWEIMNFLEKAGLA